MTDENLSDLFADDWPEDHRSGVVAVVGKPNVGKSTLINRILNQKIAIVTDKPQTTRRQQLGIFTRDDAQILFVDTPGLHSPHNQLGEYMNDVAKAALKDADAILWVLDASVAPGESDRIIAQTLNTYRGDTPVIVALNKSDLLSDETPSAEHEDLIKFEHTVPVSALEGTGVDALITKIITLVPQGPRYYPADQVSEVNLRFIAAEVIREKIIENTEQEIPYSVAVDIEEFKERSEDLYYISATIYVERDSQKGIIIGKRGSMIKQVGSESRNELAGIFGVRVYLDLHVKVLKNWRSDPTLLRRLGYFVPREDNR